ncbi:MAG TPA: lamin tail domain-containing protein, partial [Pyrinomonadaceae bacterium]|nr:lamin tail domain-containing protein [Pyrinomonadaceae bacterium]
MDINEEDTHSFTLVSGFGDNAMFAISGNQLLAGPGFVGGSGVSRNVRLRATDNSSLFVEQTFVLSSVETSQAIVINEIHYNSPNNTIREEFIELYNPTDSQVDISNWRIRGGVDYFFPANTSIPAGGFVLVAEHPPTIAARFAQNAFGPWEGGINNDGEEITLRNGLNEVVDVVDFKSAFPWPISADGEGASMQLVNPALDNDLGSSWRGATPTPGATNIIFAANAAPNIRQVNHSPEQPRSTNAVIVTCKVTDPEGVASVTLSYQIVTPGNFIPSTLPLPTAQLTTTNPNLTNSLNPAFEAVANWTTIAMTDDDGDGIYTATLPPRAHRTLVRYRITVTDSLGASRRAPFEDDPSLNFAYFVYDDMPGYQGFSPAVLQSLPVYSLITRDADINQCAAWFNTADQLPQNSGSLRNEGRVHFNWEGALVYDGVVYDHVTYRLRGANGRYHNGKRSFRIRFKDGKLLDAKDQYGRRFPTKWRELTTGKGQSNRGSETFALNEVVNMFLWNKVGVPAPLTFHFHFRVIRGAQENPADRYAGDFWGINWAQEKYDVRFLEAHNLEKGNLYKLVDNYVLGLDEMRYQAPFAPTNAADFFNIENTLTGFQSREWLEANANYPKWYRYHAIAEAIRHYDIWPSANKNGTWYFEPLYIPAN